MKLRAIALLLSLLVAVDCHSLFAQGTRLDSLESELRRIVAGSGIPGGSVALVRADGSTWTAGFGTVGAPTRAEVTPRTLFRANSISKSFVALAIVQLAEDGLLDIDTPLRDAAPGITFENQWEASHPLRLSHLLEHTSGFDDLHLREYLLEADEHSVCTALDVNPAPRVARWPPGTWMAYNNGGYAVLGCVIETVTGRPFAGVIEERILGPLGMSDSGFGLDRVNVGRLSAHFSGTVEEPRAPYPVLVRPAGALITSAEDLARFVQFLLTRGEPLLGDTSLARIERPRTTDAARAGLRVGYGLGTYTATGEEGRTWHGHAGGTPSAYARYAYQPEAGVGYAILLNGNEPSTHHGMEEAIRRFLVEPRTPPAVKDEREGEGEADLSDYEGIYRQRTSNWGLTGGFERLLDVQRVRTAGGTLTLAPLLGDVPTRLIPSGADLFRTPRAAEAQAIFLRDGENEVTGLRTWDADNLRAGNYERTAAAAVYGLIALFGLSLLLVVTAPLIALIRGIVGRLRKAERAREPLVTWLPLLAVISLFLAIGVLVVGISGSEGLLALARPSVPSVAFWALTWTFALLSVAALAVTVNALRMAGPRAGRLYSFCVAVSCVLLTGFFAWSGIIGLRPWAF